MDLQDSLQTTINEEKQTISTLTRLGAHDIEFIETGWHSRVYVAGSFVFKFPRSEKIKSDYAKEILALKYFKKINLKFQTPRVLWTHFNNNYMGLEKLEGDTIKNSPVNRPHIIGKQVGCFLNELHGLSLGVPVTDNNQEVVHLKQKYEQSLSIIKRRLNKPLQNQLRQFVLTEALIALNSYSKDMVVSHGDLDFNNMIIDSADNISFIDFGNVGYYDRSRDFAALDSNILDSVLAVYKSDNKTLREKIILRRFMQLIIDLVYFAGKKDDEGVSSMILGIESTLPVLSNQFS